MASENFLRVIPSGSDPWVAVINGEKYMYPAGTEQYVPAEVAVLIDAQELHEQPKYPPAQDDGGGAGTLVVNMTFDDRTGWASDKTFAEIETAISAGTTVVLHYNHLELTDDGEEMWHSRYYYLAKRYPGDSVFFANVEDDDSGVVRYVSLSIYEDDTIYMDKITLREAVEN